MKTIYLREKRSGNFEVSNRTNATHRFSTKKSLVEYFEGIKEKKEVEMRDGSIQLVNVTVSSPFTYGKIIKSTYSKSQTYFSNINEFWNSLR